MVFTKEWLKTFFGIQPQNAYSLLTLRLCNKVQMDELRSQRMSLMQKNLLLLLGVQLVAHIFLIAQCYQEKK